MSKPPRIGTTIPDTVRMNANTNTITDCLLSFTTSRLIKYSRIIPPNALKAPKKSP
jgi:hypothetical protein